MNSILSCKSILKMLIVFVLYLVTSLNHASEQQSDWGGAKLSPQVYSPEKVLYDLTSGDKKNIENILDRISLLYRLYESDNMQSSIVVVIHGEAIPFFARQNLDKNLLLMRRAHSLTVGSSIEFRMCTAAARLMKYEPENIHGFVKMVPMADAEIIKLQKNNYSYMK